MNVLPRTPAQIIALGKHASNCRGKPSPNRLDIKGARFGNLTAKERIGTDKFKMSVWRCICDCGKERNVTLMRLRKGDVKSCKHCHVIFRFKKDLTGKNIGLLTVIKAVRMPKTNRFKWLCSCQCGKSCCKNSFQITNGGPTSSCGCMRAIRGKNTRKEMIGKTFGKLTVSAINGKEKSGQYIYDCECICGNRISARGRMLRSGGIISCGCSRQLEKGTASFNKLFRSYQRGAKNRGLSFLLTQDYFRKIVNQPCAYCGEPPSQTVKGKSYFGHFLYNGIDRIDNNVGYEKYNCRSCCKNCNYSKSNKTLHEFVEWIFNCYDYINKQWGSDPETIVANLLSCPEGPLFESLNDDAKTPTHKRCRDIDEP